MIRYYKMVGGSKVYSKNPEHIGDKLVFNPTEAMLLADGWIKEDWQPEPVPIETLRANAIQELSDYSLKTMDRFVKEYQFLNAQASILVIQAGGTGIYDLAKAQEIVAEYNSIGTLCRNKFYSAKVDIEAAQTEDAINSVVTATKQYYDELEYSDVVENMEG